MRDLVVAHTAVDRSTDLPFKNVPGVSIPELRQLYDSVEQLFKACCFGAEYLTTCINYAETTVAGERSRSSIETVLDCVAKDSYFVNQPERKGECWPQIRKHTSDGDLRIMNEFRKRFGLPQA